MSPFYFLGRLIKPHLLLGEAKAKTYLLLGRSAQKHAVFVKPISCTDQWFWIIPKHGQKNELFRAFLSSTAVSLYVMVISFLRDK